MSRTYGIEHIIIDSTKSRNPFISTVVINEKQKTLINIPMEKEWPLGDPVPSDKEWLVLPYADERAKKYGIPQQF
jgi:hypothetical protein